MDKAFLLILENIENTLNRALPSLSDVDSKPEAQDKLKKAQEWKELVFGNIDSTLPYKYIQNLIEPNKNLISLGGKRWRPLLLILCYQMSAKEHSQHLTEEQAYSLTPLVEFVHTASLIHDDIEDSADLRRGRPAAHISYGLDTALNAASWLYFTAPASIESSGISDGIKLILYKTYTRELRKLHLGQAMDIYWHRTPSIFPSEQEYMNMVKCKTGTLASLAAQIGAIAGGMNEDEAVEIGEIAANIGIGFQIIDDVINLTTGNVGKKRGDDIVEGKKSLPVILHAEMKPEDKADIELYMKEAAKEGIDSPAVEKCIKLLESNGAIEAAAKRGTSLIKENSKKLNSKLIEELFISMIPENFR